jgi:SAM-dependent methyltransferase
MNIVRISLVRNRNKEIKKDGCIQVHYSDLYTLADSTIDYIDCEDTLDYTENPVEILQMCAKKLRVGGKLCVRALDFIAFAENFAEHRNGLPQLMKRKFVSHLEEMRDLVCGVGLSIVDMSLSKERYIIYAERKGV